LDVNGVVDISGDLLVTGDVDIIGIVDISGQVTIDGSLILNSAPVLTTFTGPIFKYTDASGALDVLAGSIELLTLSVTPTLAASKISVVSSLAAATGTPGATFTTYLSVLEDGTTIYTSPLLVSEVSSASSVTSVTHQYGKMSGVDITKTYTIKLSGYAAAPSTVNYQTANLSVYANLS
jgi:hypothetical protein